MNIKQIVARVIVFVLAVMWASVMIGMPLWCYIDFYGPLRGIEMFLVVGAAVLSVGGIIAWAVINAEFEGI